jgi:hypothetical protein
VSLTIYIRSDLVGGMPDLPTTVVVALGPSLILLVVIGLLIWRSGATAVLNKADVSVTGTNPRHAPDGTYVGRSLGALRPILYLVSVIAAGVTAASLAGVGNSYEPSYGYYVRALIFIQCFELLAVLSAMIAAVLPDFWGKLQVVTESLGAGGLAENKALKAVMIDVETELVASRASRASWFRWNLLTTALTATFSAAAGVSGLLDNAPAGVRITLASLALLGAGLTALTPALRAPQRYAVLVRRSNALDTLQRDMKFELARTNSSSIDATRYFKQFQAILADTSGDPESGAANHPVGHPATAQADEKDRPAT